MFAETVYIRMPTGSVKLAHLSVQLVCLPLHAALVLLDSVSTDLIVLSSMLSSRRSPSVSRMSAEGIALFSSLLDSISLPTVSHPPRRTTSSWLCPILETESTMSINGNQTITPSLWQSHTPPFPLSLLSSSQ